MNMHKEMCEKTAHIRVHIDKQENELTNGMLLKWSVKDAQIKLAKAIVEKNPDCIQILEDKLYPKHIICTGGLLVVSPQEIMNISQRAYADGEKFGTQEGIRLGKKMRRPVKPIMGKRKNA